MNWFGEICINERFSFLFNKKQKSMHLVSLYVLIYTLLKMLVDLLKNVLVNC